jgi:ATP-dependent exoDNAse (exonuclease V) beta subunit
LHLRDFVDEVKRRILYDDDAQEAELDLDGVRVLTIHQAKGLEWPFVFVACSTRYQYDNAEPTDRVVEYDMATGGFALKHDVDGRETFHWSLLTTEHDPATGQRIKSGLRRGAHEREQARVFYVAVTRAKKRVYLTAPAPAPAPGRSSGAARFLAPIRDWANGCRPGVDLSFHRDDAPVQTPATAAGAMTQLRLIESVPAADQPTPTLMRPRISFTAISAFETCPNPTSEKRRLDSWGSMERTHRRQ